MATFFRRTRRTAASFPAPRAKLVMEPLEVRTVPATFTVSTLDDSGAGSLRTAVTLANIAPGADIINFQPGLTGTIALTRGQLLVSDSVTIQGPGAGVITISGNNSSRVFGVVGSAGPINVAISGLTLTQGNAGIFSGIPNPGGAIAAFDVFLVLSDAVITRSSTGSAGGGVFLMGAGSLAVERCTISGNSADAGGGIGVSLAAATTVVRNSTISDNNAGGEGGGIVCVGPVIIENTTISGNKAAVRGGGVSNGNSDGTLILRNSTVAFNTADSDNNGGGLGGGIFVAGTSATLQSTIVADNLVGTTGADPDISGSVTATSSLVGNTTGTTFAVGSGANITGTDPILGPLADNGGPTRTHALLPGSPAINHGSNPAGLGSDQRGFPFLRLFGAGVDIGAIETQPNPHPTGQALQPAIQIFQTLRARLAALVFPDMNGDFVNDIVLALRLRNNRLLIANFDGIDGHILGAFQPFQTAVGANARVQLVALNLNADPMLEIGLIVTPGGPGVPHISAFTVTGVRVL